MVHACVREDIERRSDRLETRARVVGIVGVLVVLLVLVLVLVLVCSM
jgi:hypothetical protein